MRYFPEGVWRVAISSDKTLSWSDQTGRALSAKVENKKIPTSQKNLLTNRVKRVILNSRGEGKAVPKGKDPRESVRPIPDDPTARCSCVRDTNVNQTTQAEKMSWIRRIHKPLLFTHNGWDFVLYR